MQDFFYCFLPYITVYYRFKMITIILIEQSNSTKGNIMARPKTQISKRRHNHITLNLTDKEFKKINEEASKLGLSQSTYVVMELRKHGII